MSWQKCMSFSKRSNLEAKNVINFKLCHRTMISDKKNLENKVFHIGFMHLKIKIKEKFRQNSLGQKFKNQFHTTYAESFQLPKAV